MWDWLVSRAGQCLFIGLSCSIPTIVFYYFSLSLVSVYMLVLWGWGLLTDRVYIISLSLAQLTSFNNNNQMINSIICHFCIKKAHVHRFVCILITVKIYCLLECKYGHFCPICLLETKLSVCRDSKTCYSTLERALAIAIGL